jgi:hypothetical protein
MTGVASTGHGPQAPIDIRYIDTESPILKGLDGWKTVNEELYNNSAGKLLDTAQPLAKGKQTFKNTMLDVDARIDSTLFAAEYGGDRHPLSLESLIYLSLLCRAARA